ncbi:hypothetical protein F2Q69_00035291 [Brassica cretica]|uniref:Uncharacterized protein n=1 Tax=Brassica cretica TaxID=69181 RepID=A0A8S9SQM3_BRACR|nr:hypothetical protein F2Q69_00035291 [Brassica cretica]
MTKSRNKGQTVGEKYSGIEFLQTPGRTPASGSPLGSTPGPVPGITPSSGKWKTSDMDNLPYFRIWKSLTYSNRLRPTSRRLYKGKSNPRGPAPGPRTRSPNIRDNVQKLSSQGVSRQLKKTNPDLKPCVSISPFLEVQNQGPESCKIISRHVQCLWISKASGKIPAFRFPQKWIPVPTAAFVSTSGAFMGTVGAVCNMQTNQLCLTLVDPNVYYDPIRVVKPHTSYMEIRDDPGAKRE